MFGIEVPKSGYGTDQIRNFSLSAIPDPQNKQYRFILGRDGAAIANGRLFYKTLRTPTKLLYEIPSGE